MIRSENMVNQFCRLTLLLSLLITDCDQTAKELFAADLQYNRDIRPILSDKCFFCHGPDEEHRQADLRLDVESDAKEYAIQAGKPDESEVIARILSADPELLMPPPNSGKSLSPQEIKTLRKWIEQGADYAPYWAYLAPQQVSPPEVPGLGNDSTAKIDRFIRARLQQEGLSPSAPADPVTLIRRVYFDLIGLPPLPEKVDAFVADPSAKAFEKIVDELLQSDHFGERMAVYWLDLVRYADTVGYHGDQDHHISPYRDWVINAFNENLPFDQFTREQLAGDLLPEATIDQKVATGYNRMLQTSHEGGVQPKEYLAIYAADRVRNLSAVWMGATVGCAQCHHHKYDPYSIRDFYSLAAFFADVDEAQHFTLGSNALPTRRPPEIEVLSKRDRQRLMEIENQLAATESLDAQVVESLNAEKNSIEARKRLTMITVAIEPREMRVLPRGNWLDDSGPVVSPAIPEFLGELKTSGRRPNRLDLANWLTNSETGVGGLTARVQVNRFWYLLFGTGLSRTLDDFGGQGEPPSHPELLDDLAVEFMEQEWDVKSLLKTILLSQTYQQGSTASPALLAKDPYNQLFARQGRFRLPAEFVRDTALLIAGSLEFELGGPSIRPYQPQGYYRHLNFPKREYTADEDSRQFRRGVYIHWQRQFLHPMLKAFDAPSREECTAQRPQSNTPLAALVLLNDPTFVEAARHFAQNLLTEADITDEDRLEMAFRQAISRRPDSEELNILKQLLINQRRHYAASAENAEALLEVGLSDVDSKFDPVELAAWTTVTRAILNLNETFTRN